ncbi:hypothetical protein BKA70DRAFT_1394553 [Coprinopsis sp. MPI-PUGE-AT-0042]|nr:hypothetical protein BKA70DRAFT_1394553 [Coprinopsis sp. MPI-PUGE-AT-0042]
MTPEVASTESWEPHVRAGVGTWPGGAKLIPPTGIMGLFAEAIGTLGAAQTHGSDTEDIENDEMVLKGTFKAPPRCICEARWRLYDCNGFKKLITARRAVQDMKRVVYLHRNVVRVRCTLRLLAARSDTILSMHFTPSQHSGANPDPEGSRHDARIRGKHLALARALVVKSEKKRAYHKPISREWLLELLSVVIAHYDAPQAKHATLTSTLYTTSTMIMNHATGTPSDPRDQEQFQIQGVPDDILHEVFIRSLPDEVTFATSEAPLLLCQICSRWRSLSIGYAPLWASLKLVISERDPIPVPGEEGFFTWFGRCKGLTLDFFLIFHRKLVWLDSSLTPPLTRHFAFLSRSLAHVPSYNFRHLTLHGVPFHVVHTLPRGALLCLERLVLAFKFYQTPIDWTSEEPIRAFEQCSLLQRVALDGVFLAPDLCNALAIPWNQLTHFFYLCELAPKDYLHCVSKMTNLVHGCFCLGDQAAGDIEPPSPELDLSTIQVKSTTPDFWRSFDFPNLRTLQIIGTRCAEMASAGYWDDQQSFLARLRSLGHLEKLSLSIDEFNSHDCEAFFQCCPNITHLDLDTSDDRYQAVLMALHSDVGYLPKLKALALEVGNSSAYRKLYMEGLDDDDIVQTSALLSMVESRRSCEPQGQLKRIVFYGAEACQVSNGKASHRCLEPCIEQGLTVEHKVEKEVGLAGLCDPVLFGRHEQLSDWREAAEIFRNNHEGQ